MGRTGAMSLNHFEKVLQVGSERNIHQEGRNKCLLVLLFMFDILSTERLLWVDVK